MRYTERITPWTAAPLLAAALLGACSDFGPRVYTARLYRRAGCLEPYAALGLVQSGALGALCPPVCLRLDGELYVSSVCPPYPARSSVAPAADADCAEALAASARGASCEPPDAAASDGSIDEAPLTSDSVSSAAPVPGGSADAAPGPE
jgi:hypothetical protein